MASYYYVYVIFRSSGIPCYIGKGRGQRITSHFRSAQNKHLKSIIKAAGGNLPVVKLRENLTNEEAIITEIALIAAIGRKDLKKGPLVNLTDGGEGNNGWRPSSTTRARLSVSTKKRFESPRERRHLSEALTGFRHSEETRARMSATHKANPSMNGRLTKDTKWWHTPAGKNYRAMEQRAPEDLPGAIRNITEETRKKISETHAGKSKTAEHKAKLSISNKITKAIRKKS